MIFCILVYDRHCYKHLLDTMIERTRSSFYFSFRALRTKFRKSWFLDKYDIHEIYSPKLESLFYTMYFYDFHLKV